jgi:hypothetical protein
MPKTKPPRKITLVLQVDEHVTGPPQWVVSSPELPDVVISRKSVAKALERMADALRSLGLNYKAKDCREHDQGRTGR